MTEAVPEEGARVLVVCLGNLCRSPLAERLLAQRLQERLGSGATPVTVGSAGVRAVVGSAMEELAAGELTRLGGDPSGHVARQLTPQLVEGADLVLTATRGIRTRVLEESPRALKRTFTLLELAGIVAGEGFSQPPPASLAELVARAASRRGAGVVEYDVADPIGAGPEVHREVADVIDRACTTIARAIAEVYVDGGRLT